VTTEIAGYHIWTASVFTQSSDICTSGYGTL